MTDKKDKSQEVSKSVTGESQLPDEALKSYHLEIDVNKQRLTEDGVELMQGEPLPEGALSQLPPRYNTVGVTVHEPDLKGKLKEALSLNPSESGNLSLESQIMGGVRAIPDPAQASGKETETEPRDSAADAGEESLKEDAAVKVTVNGDDPDRVPVVPTLRDDEVPNMPGAILRHAREILGLSQREVALRLKLRVNTISDIEHDRLNQPTAAAFVRGHIVRYARLVHIQPEAVLELYNQNVSELQARLDTGEGLTPRKSSYKKPVYAFIIFAIALGLGVNFFLSREPEVAQGTSEELVLNAATPEPVAGTGEAESGEIAINVAPEGQSAETAVTDEGALPAPVPALDENTRQALAQAEALNQEETEVPSGKTEALSTEALHVDPQILAASRAGAGSDPAKDNLGVITRVESEEIRSAPDNAAAQRGKAAALPAAAQSAGSVQGTSALAAETKIAAENVKEPETAAQRAEENSPAPALSAQLMDISSRARLQGREGLASMNSGALSFKAPAYVRVTDSRGKVLAEGAYKTGESVRFTGIPPLKVAVSDSSAIRVSYMGGTVVTPSVKQVQFTLPSDERR